MRQRVRKFIALVSFLVFPLTVFYFSPMIVVMGAFEGVVAGSALMFAAMLVAGMVFGRSACGWLCPSGALQDMATSVVGKPAKLGWRRLVKYVIWAPWVASIVLGFVVAGGVRSVEPLYHIDGGVSVGSTSFSIFIYLAVLAVFLVPNLFLGRRAMCHWICWMAPFMVVGEKLGRLLHIPQLHVAARPDTCIGCGKCTKACPMSLDVRELLKTGRIADAECIDCAVCVDICPKETLQLRFAQVPKAQAVYDTPGEEEAALEGVR